MLSLRGMLAATTLLVVALALLVCGALVVLTTALHRSTSRAAANVESVRLAEEAEVDLLLHERASEPLVRRSLEGELRRRLANAREFVTTDDEARVLSEAVSKVERYLESARFADLAPKERVAHGETAFVALEALVTVNVAQAREAQQDAARWNRLANIVGIAVGGLLLLIAGGILVWLKRRAFEPVFSLAAAMERFGKGDRDVRTRETGPAELRDMSRRFNEMAAALGAQRQAQMTFLGGVAHDLKNPLSVLKLSLAAVGPDRPLPSEARLRQVVQRVDRQITRLERMAGDFLDIARIEAGELELHTRSHDARILVRSVVELFEGASAHRVELSLPRETVPVQCDQVRIEQVVTNLLSNAIKYSAPDAPIEVAVERRGHEAVLSVSDQGVGIAKEDRERVFEPFRRVGLSKENAPGVGLGLFVVRRIVEAHGGHIELESAPGAGSIFRVFLPLGRDVRGVMERPVDAPPPQQPPEP